jgi:hypothetical protein
VPHVEKELITFPEHVSSTSVVSEARVDRSLVYFAVFCSSLFVLLSFYFGHCNYLFGTFNFLPWIRKGPDCD